MAQQKPRPTIQKPPAPQANLEVPAEVVAPEVKEEESADLAEVVEEPSEEVKEEEKPSEEELIVRQQQAEADVVPLPDVETHRVIFRQPHTFGYRVYVAGESADVPKDHPFYGLTPKEQEEKFGVVHFVVEN